MLHQKSSDDTTQKNQKKERRKFLSKKCYENWKKNEFGGMK